MTRIFHSFFLIGQPARWCLDNIIVEDEGSGKRYKFDLDRKLPKDGNGNQVITGSKYTL